MHTLRYWLLCIIFTTTSCSAGDDEPLMLTPLIDDGKIDEARGRAKVKLPESNVESYSGFITVIGISHIFFWYFPAVIDQESAPVVLCLNGELGVSSSFAIFFESGPISFKMRKLTLFNWKRYKLKNRPLPYINTAHIIYVDIPVGVGFSFTEIYSDHTSNLENIGIDVYNLLQQFFKLFPNLQSNKFYVMGESYGGKLAAATAYRIHLENNISDGQNINLQGLMIGNCFCDPDNMKNANNFDSSFGSLDKNIISDFKKKEQTLPLHKQDDNEKANLVRSYLDMNIRKQNSLFDMEGFLPTIRKKIHVGGSKYSKKQETKIVKNNLFDDLSISVMPWIKALVAECKIIFYSGEYDPIVPYIATENSLNHFNWNGRLKWTERSVKYKKWHIHNELAGYWKTVDNLTHVRIKDAGHYPFLENPLRMYNLFQHFVTGNCFS